MKYSTAVRIYVACLLLTLAVEIELFALPFLGVESVPLHFFMVPIGALLPLARFPEFRRFASEQRLLLALTALFLASGFLSAILSPFPPLFCLKWLSRYVLFLFASLLLLFLFSLDSRLILFFFRAVFGLAAILALISCVEANSDGFSRWLADSFRNGERDFFSGRARAAAMLTNPNIFGCFMAFSVLLTLHLRQTAAIGRAAFLSAVPLACAALMLSGSRNALLVLAVSLSALLFQRKTAARALFALGIALVLFGAMPSRSRFAELWKGSGANRSDSAPEQTDAAAMRGDSPSEIPSETKSAPERTDQTAAVARPRYDAVRARKMLWQSALAMARDYPLFGVGPGGVNRALKKYAPEELRSMDGEKIERGYLNAHNGLFQILAEFGLVGASLGALFFFSLAFRIFRRIGAFPPSTEHALLLSLFLSFASDAFFYSVFYMVLASTTFFLFASFPKGFAPNFPPPPKQTEAE